MVDKGLSATKDTKSTKELKGEPFDPIPQPPDVEVDDRKGPLQSECDALQLELMTQALHISLSPASIVKATASGREMV